MKIELTNSVTPGKGQKESCGVVTSNLGPTALISLLIKLALCALHIALDINKIV